MAKTARTAYLSEFLRAGVFRASAIFWVVEGDGIATTVEYLNYWKFKHAVVECTVLWTLRGMSGEVVARRQEVLTEVRGYSLAVGEMLGGAGHSGSFEGSLEFELFAGREIRIAFPALLCLIRGAGWQAMVHTYARTYSTVSGDAPGQLFEVETAAESNWSLHDDGDHESFVILHNGPLVAPPGEVELEAFDADGRRLPIRVPLATRGPGETTRILPGRFADLTTFLGGRPGWMRARFPVRGVFPRLAAGHRRKGDGAILAIVHSHHDGIDDDPMVPVPADGPERPMFITVPTSSRPPWTTRVVAYPTTRMAPYRVRVRRFDPSGTEIGSAIDGALGAWDDGTPPAALPLAQGDHHNGDGVMDVAVFPLEASIPSRFHVGVELDRPGEFPVRFTTGLATFRKPRYSTYWLPILYPELFETHIAVIHTDDRSGDFPDAQLMLTIHRSADEETLPGSLRIAPNGAFLGQAEEMAPGVEEFLGGTTGWVVLRSEHPVNLHLFFATVNRRTGLVSADHGF